MRRAREYAAGHPGGDRPGVCPWMDPPQPQAPPVQRKKGSLETVARSPEGGRREKEAAAGGPLGKPEGEHTPGARWGKPPCGSGAEAACGTRPLGDLETG